MAAFRTIRRPQPSKPAQGRVREADRQAGALGAFSPFAGRGGKGPLTEPTSVSQAWRGIPLLTSAKLTFRIALPRADTVSELECLMLWEPGR
jgi:hypothetical protein